RDHRRFCLWSATADLNSEVVHGFMGFHREDPLMKKYLVTLTPEERQSLYDLTTAGKAAAQRLTHARILLKADQADSGPAWTDERIAEALDVGLSTIARVRQRFVEQGLPNALGRKPQDRPSPPPKLDGRAEALNSVVGGPLGDTRGQAASSHGALPAVNVNRTGGGLMGRRDRKGRSDTVGPSAGASPAARSSWLRPLRLTPVSPSGSRSGPGCGREPSPAPSPSTCRPGWDLASPRAASPPPPGRRRPPWPGGRRSPAPAPPPAAGGRPRPP